jgi:hypothetical protein
MLFGVTSASAPDAKSGFIQADSADSRVSYRRILRYDLEEMRGVRFGALGFFYVVAGAIAGCGVDAPLFTNVVGGSGESGEGGDAGQAGEGAGVGGTLSGSAGQAGDGEIAGASGAAEGGAGDHGAGEGGEGNTNSGRGGSGGTNRGGSSGNAGGAGGSSGGGSGGVDYPDRLDICDSLTNTGTLSYNATLAYEVAMLADCRANWTFAFYYEGNDRADFLNRIVQWNLRLWGCQTALPRDFPLVYQGNGVERVLTRGDAQALIDAYLGVVDDMLGLAPADVSDLRGILSRSSEPALFSNSDELSNSACSQGSGGAAGSGGQAGSSGSAGFAGSAGLGGNADSGGSAGDGGAAGAGEFGGAGGEGAVGG